MRGSMGLAIVMVLAMGGLQVLAAPAPLLELEEGVNDVLLTVVNQGAVDLDGVTLSVDAGKLPPWIHAMETRQAVSVLKGSKGSEKLAVRIEVRGAPRDAWAEFPFRLRDRSGESWSVPVMARVTARVPTSYELTQNAPNPFNPDTMIRYAVASMEAQPTQVIIVNALGQQVRTLVDARQPAGSYIARWDGRDDQGQRVASGVYAYRLRSGNFIETKKMLLTK